ncbi:MAG: beta-N-acetylhexosaminidase [Bacteroidota bacterium]
MFRKIALLLLFTVAPLGLFSQNAKEQLMPMPQQITWGSQRYNLDQSFHVVLSDLPGSRTHKAVVRFLRRLNDRTHLMTRIDPVLKSGDVKGVSLDVSYQRVGNLLPGEDESYELNVTGDRVTLSATTDIGVQYGLETFLQLVSSDSQGYFIPGVSIKDRPRFPWRGLLIDVCRHWSPIEVIKRNIDGMCMMKMNVLHLHLTEDQGFRIESKKLPKLHLMGSNGDFYTQDQMREIIRYASDRGIRVVPEFDMPGHASSWMPGYPELASGPGPHQIERKFGVFDPTIDPTKKSTYKLLDRFLGEMADLFPDPYMHIGGDENNGKQWDKNPRIQEFMRKHGIKDNHALQNHFNKKVMAILKKHGKKTIGWDEILQPGLPSDAVIQSWRGKEGLKDAATKGHQVILSNGYYIDLSQPTWQHYANDPLPASLGLTPEQERMVLGGEATMWAELVTPETIDSRIWPRTAAIAERLWSNASVNDVMDMYRRLETISIRLEEVGLTHIRNRDMMLRRLAPGRNIEPLAKLVEVVEPLKEYKRHAQGIPYSTDMPFSRLPDIAVPDAPAALKFRLLCEQLVMKRDPSVKPEIKSMLQSWIDNHEKLKVTASGIPALANWIRMSEELSIISNLGLECLDFMERRQVITDEWTKQGASAIQNARKPFDESELMIVDALNMLFNHTLPK